MASKSARKRRKRRPPSPGAVAESNASQSRTQEAQRPPGRKPTRTQSGAHSARHDERPPAPWGSFPLVELSVLAGLIMLILGFFFIGGEGAPVLIAAGLALGSIGGLDLSIREHFSGYQSHTLILAGLPALIAAGALFYAGPDGLPALARAAIAIAVFVAAAALLARAFSRRSGGLRYRFRPLGGRGR